MAGFALVPGLISFYTFYTTLFHRFLYKKKIIQLALAGILVSVASALAGYAVLLFLILRPATAFAGGANATVIILCIITFGAAINGIIALVMKGFIDWYGDIKFKAALNKKNFDMEMALIRSQLDPHFLFNTINNIDVLIEKDAAKASEYLNKLSGIMRFMLYETKTEKILLTKELLYIEKYLELQKIRTANIEFVKYSVEGNVENIEIAPMLFIPFIENAFKHADNKKAGNAILIQVAVNDRSILFTCQNSYVATIKGHEKEGGIGNGLIAKRLQLLYPASHALSIVNENNLYVVQLSIDIYAD